MLLDPLYPDVEGTVASKQADQKLHHESIGQEYSSWASVNSRYCHRMEWTTFIPCSSIR